MVSSDRLIATCPPLNNLWYTGVPRLTVQPAIWKITFSAQKARLSGVHSVTLLELLQLTSLHKLILIPLLYVLLFSPLIYNFVQCTSSPLKSLIFASCIDFINRAYFSYYFNARLFLLHN